MSVTINDFSNYNSINKINFGEKVVFFKVGADWCTPCNELNNIINNIPDSIIYNISIDNENFESFFIENKFYSIPDTIVKYKGSTTRFQGIRTIEQITKIIEDLKKTYQ